MVHSALVKKGVNWTSSLAASRFWRLIGIVAPHPCRAPGWGSPLSSLWWRLLARHEFECAASHIHVHCGAYVSLASTWWRRVCIGPGVLGLVALQPFGCGLIGPKVKELTMPGGVFTAMLPWVPLYLLYGPGGVGRRYRWRARGLTASLARILHCELVEDGAPA